MIDIDELITVIENLQRNGRISIIDDAVGAIKKLDTQLSAFKRIYNEASINLQYAENENQDLKRRLTAHIKGEAVESMCPACHRRLWFIDDETMDCPFCEEEPNE